MYYHILIKLPWLCFLRDTQQICSHPHCSWGCNFWPIGWRSTFPEWPRPWSSSFRPKTPEAIVLRGYIEYSMSRLGLVLRTKEPDCLYSRKRLRRSLGPNGGLRHLRAWYSGLWKKKKTQMKSFTSLKKNNMTKGEGKKTRNEYYKLQLEFHLQQVKTNPVRRLGN